MRAALRYGDVSADRMGVFAADLRRLRQVKCGNQFALPAGLLSRILMNLSLSAHTQIICSHTFTQTHISTLSLAGGNEKTAGLITAALEAVWVQITWSFHSTLSKQLQGNEVKVKPGVQPQLHSPIWTQNTHTWTHLQPGIYKTETKHTPAAATHRYRCTRGKHQRNTWALSSHPYKNSRGKVCQRRKPIYHNLGMEMNIQIPPSRLTLHLHTKKYKYYINL